MFKAINLCYFYNERVGCPLLGYDGDEMMILDSSVWWNRLVNSLYQSLTCERGAELSFAHANHLSGLCFPTRRQLLLLSFLPQKGQVIIGLPVFLLKNWWKHGGKTQIGSRRCTTQALSQVNVWRASERRVNTISSCCAQWKTRASQKPSVSLPLFRHAAIVWGEKLMPHCQGIIAIYFDCASPVSDTQRLSVDC